MKQNVFKEYFIYLFWRLTKKPWTYSRVKGLATEDPSMRQTTNPQ